MGNKKILNKLWTLFGLIIFVILIVRVTFYYFVYDVDPDNMTVMVLAMMYISITYKFNDKDNKD
jgi:heme/copper-type cytochrome/quinol oxidase subunit 2